MPVLINKDGQQRGPYSLEEARTLVLSGELASTDWAWPDGATQWIKLKDVRGFAPGTPAAAVEETPPPPPNTEQEMWRGHPSQILNLGTYLFWAMALLADAIASQIVSFGPSGLWSTLVFGGIALIGFVHLNVCFFHLRATEYVVTTQRVRVVSGLLGKDIQEIELFRVKDTAAHQTFFLRLFGLGTINIVSGDANHPRLVLTGIPKALELREKLRQEIMTLRQRFGVRELDVM